MSSSTNSVSDTHTTLQSHGNLITENSTSGQSEPDEVDEERSNTGHYHDTARNVNVTRVEGDGIQYTRERDAPGQACSYIPPGDHDSEKYRTATFFSFPRDVPVLPVALSKAGFYYTGYKDRVKCFSCGVAVEDWMNGDDAFDAKWHKRDCQMSRKEDRRNVPASSNYVILIGEILKRTPRRGRYTQTVAMLADESQGNSREMNEVARSFEKVNISTQQPLVLATILDADHERLLRSLDLRKESNRRKTFTKWPSYPAPLLFILLAEEGFFYVGNLDRTQCFACSGILRNWTAEDDVRTEHRKHFPHCRFLRDREGCGNIPMSRNERRDADEADRIRVAQLLPSNIGEIVEPPNPSAEEQKRLAEFFPCRDPMNPHMNSASVRLETFDSRWRQNILRASPEQIAKAGFYFLGEGDRCKCWYCNGGLQNWEPNDEPWTEHAKWFPGCEFVLRKKGVEFVQQLTQTHPNLNRPAISNPVVHYVPPPAAEPEHPVRNALNISAIENMGFKMERINKVMERKKNLNGVGYSDTQELIDDLLDGVGEETQSQIPMHFSEQPGFLPVQGNKKRGSSNESEDIAKKIRTHSPISLQEEIHEENAIAADIKAMQEAGMCKRCHAGKAEFMCIPCGHLAACSKCENEMGRCFICRRKVQSTMKVYRA